MLTEQAYLFDLPEYGAYLNAAYMSPQLRAVTEVGIQALNRKSRPQEITVDDFFTDRQRVKQIFAELIGTDDPERVCIIPSVSYGMANAAANIPLTAGDEIVLIEEQFPSNVYTWKKVAKQNGAKCTMVGPPPLEAGRGQFWNERLLEAISKDTRVVALPHIHWADGTRYDLEAVREKLDEQEGYLVLDGTQSIGAYPFDNQIMKADVVICAGYKWLMGPYSIGVAYYNERFDSGIPIEDNWMNRLHSENFAGLTQYQEAYQPKAARYTVGESSNFVLMPMLAAALEQVLEWDPGRIQSYCEALIKDFKPAIRDKGYFLEDDAWRASHLFGIYLGPEMQMEDLKKRLQQAGVFVSYRGEAIRISPHVYNTKADLEFLLNSL